jgi:hypothetical protein
MSVLGDLLIVAVGVAMMNGWIFSAWPFINQRVMMFLGAAYVIVGAFMFASHWKV